MTTQIAFLVLSTSLTFLAATTLSPSLHAEEIWRKQIDRLVQPYLDNKLVVGMTIGVLDKDHEEIIGYGSLSEADRRVPAGDTIYEIGSATKVFTGLLLADAVARGSVKLDQPAGELLPPGVKMPAQVDRPITLQDLATHVSGLPRLPDNLKPADPNNPYADYTVDNLYEFLNHHTLDRAPGQRAEYSNLGMGLLGHLLALKQQTTYEQLLRDRITTPLNMTSTTITLDADQKARLAPPHDADGSPNFNWDLPTLAGAGAIRSTATDMLRLAQANLNSASRRTGPGNRIGLEGPSAAAGQRRFCHGSWLACRPRWNHALSQRPDRRLPLRTVRQPSFSLERRPAHQHRRRRGRYAGRRHPADDGRRQGRTAEVRKTGRSPS